MTDTPGPPPLRVERALRVLPDLATLLPLRALLIASSRPDRRGVWASAGPYLTVGKHLVQPAELAAHVPKLLEQVQTHLAALYAAVIEALEAEQRGDPGAEVAALMRAAQREELLGRLSEARRWCESALTVSGSLQDRRAETEVLLSLGRLCLALGQYPDSARHYQRAFALAEAEFDQSEVIEAAEGLARIALAQESWPGAQAWFSRALRLAEAGDNATHVAQLQQQIATVALGRGDLTAAREQLARAREGCEALGMPLEMARVLSTEALLNARLGSPPRAVAAYREALAWIRRAGGQAKLEATIRLDLAALYLESERYLEAEQEARGAERLAITHNLTRHLVEVYTFLGRVRGHQRDETGFVFFEQALELCRGLDRSPAVAGQVYYAYAAFRERIGQPADARELLQHARTSFEPLGEVPQLERVRADLARLSA
jgi:tetratricopeptide (TPR) repeat protein